MWSVEEFRTEYEYRLAQELDEVMGIDIDDFAEGVTGVLREADKLEEGEESDLGYCISRAVAEILDSMTYEFMDNNGIESDGGSETGHGPRKALKSPKGHSKWYGAAYAESACSKYTFDSELRMFSSVLWENDEFIKFELDRIVKHLEEQLKEQQKESVKQS